MTLIFKKNLNLNLFLINIVDTLIFCVKNTQMLLSFILKCTIIARMLVVLYELRLGMFEYGAFPWLHSIIATQKLA
jgi:hypothetical protein